MTRTSRWRAPTTQPARPTSSASTASCELQYRGRLDASRNRQDEPGLRRDLFEAMREVAASGAGPRDQIASIGCSIKWKD